MLFRKNLTVCSKPLTFGKDRDTRHRSESSDSSETRGSDGSTAARFLPRVFCSGSSLNVLFRKTATEMSGRGCHASEDPLSRERAETDRQRDRRRQVCVGSLRLHHNSLHAWPKRGLASRHSRKSASSSATFIRRLSTRRALCSGTKRLRWLGPRPYRPSGSIEARFFIKFLLNPRGPNHARVQAGRGETLK